MQVELSDNAETLINEYRALVKKEMAEYNPSTTALANSGIIEHFTKEIQKRKKAE